VLSAQGLSLERIRRVLAKCLASHGKIEPEDVELILAEKRQSIRQTQILDFYPATEQISDIGGLDNLKDWLIRRGGAFSERSPRLRFTQSPGFTIGGNSGDG
jgi:DNA-binding transcriptional MerR regulator